MAVQRTMSRQLQAAVFCKYFSLGGFVGCAVGAVQCVYWGTMASNEFDQRRKALGEVYNQLYDLEEEARLQGKTVLAWREV